MADEPFSAYAMALPVTSSSFGASDFLVILLNSIPYRVAWTNLITGDIDVDTIVAGNIDVPAAFGSVAIGVGYDGGRNAVVGYAKNTLADATTAFPAGTVGNGELPAGVDGNQVFGLYGLAEIYATGGGVAVAAEVTARNYSGNSPDANLPPDTSIGTATTVPIGLNVTAGTQIGNDDCSIGLHVSNESGLYSDPAFLTGAYIRTFRTYGIFVESQTSGSQISCVLSNNGTGQNLRLITTSAMSATNAVMTVADNGAVDRFSVRQNGGIWTMELLHFNGAGQTSATVGVAGAATVLPANPTGYLFVDIGGFTKRIPYYE